MLFGLDSGIVASVSDFAIDQATGDLALLDGSPYLVTDNEAIKQHLKIRLQFWLGEWFLDLSEGIPLRTHVLIRAPSIVVLRSIFSQVIVDTPGISEVRRLTLSFDRQNRGLAVSFSAVLEEGGALDFSEAFEVRV